MVLHAAGCLLIEHSNNMKIEKMLFRDAAPIKWIEKLTFILVPDIRSRLKTKQKRH